MYQCVLTTATGNPNALARSLTNPSWTSADRRRWLMSFNSSVSLASVGERPVINSRSKIPNCLLLRPREARNDFFTWLTLHTVTDGKKTCVGDKCKRQQP